MKKEHKSKLKNIKRRNAKLYPIYKMFSWDLLCYYSIEYLFLTITKGINVSDVLFLSAFYLVSKMLVQIPAVILCDFFGRKKSIVFGNAILSGYIFFLIIAPNFGIIMFANFLCSLGFAIKKISESNLLCDSVTTRGGDGLYTKIDSKGAGMYYVLDGIAALSAGYLFVINNYLPMFICLGCLVVATIIACNFKDVYPVKRDNSKSLGHTFKEYGEDLKDTCKFIIHSKRMKALILFKMVFYSLIKIIEVYRGDLLVEIGVPEEQFSMIFAILTFIAAIAVSMRETLEKKFKNRTLTFLAITYILAVLNIGIISRVEADIVLPLLLTMYVIIKISSSIWYILEGKYLKNFTNEKIRSKITFTYELISCMVAAVSSILAGKLVEIVSIQNAFLLIGLIGLVAIVLTLDYMRPRFGLNPKEYDKRDIEFQKT